MIQQKRSLQLDLKQTTKTNIITTKLQNRIKAGKKKQTNKPHMQCTCFRSGEQKNRKMRHIRLTYFHLSIIVPLDKFPPVQEWSQNSASCNKEGSSGPAVTLHIYINQMIRPYTQRQQE